MLPHSNTNRQAPSLLVDAMLGRLARWLRLLGFDAAYWQTGSDEDLMKRAQAEDRLIITRDHGLAGRRQAWALLVTKDSLEDQLVEVCMALGTTGQLFTRCAECNGLLEELPHEAVRDFVPPYVWHTQNTFRRCLECGRLYWRGTHWPALREKLEAIVASAEASHFQHPI